MYDCRHMQKCMFIAFDVLYVLAEISQLLRLDMLL